MTNPKFLAIIFVIFVALGIYLFKPATYLLNPMLFAVILGSGALGAGLWVFAIFALELEDDLKDSREGTSVLLVIGAILALCILALVGPAAYNYLPGQAQKIAGVLGTPVKIVEQRLPDLDIQNAPLVPENLARRKAELALASIGSKASQLQVGKLVKQEIGGKLAWVGFLEPSGFFRWLNMDGTPGYVTVSATDHSDVKLVTEIGGKPLSLKYTGEAYFSQQIRRHTWLDSPSLHTSNFTPEIDNDGKPYYVASVIEPTVAQSGYDVVGVLIIDPQTGAIEKFSPQDAPSWVDIIQDAYVIQEQIENAGEFVHGRFNWASLDKFEHSSFDQVFAKDGKSYWVAGITSRTNKSGVQRFLFIDTRSKESFEYEVNGILEDRASQIVLDSHTKVYEASNPVPFLVNGRPTYVMSLSLGDAIYGYGMVDIESETIFSSKPTLVETLQAYLSARTNSGLPGQENVANEDFQGTLFRIGQDAKSGNFTFLLSSQKEVFVASPNLSNYLSLAQPGDDIQVKGQRFNETTVNVVSFKVKNLEQ